MQSPLRGRGVRMWFRDARFAHSSTTGWSLAARTAVVQKTEAQSFFMLTTVQLLLAARSRAFSEPET